MSIPSLLGHFGISDQRFVTADGRIIFDGVQKSPLGVGYTHAEFGSVTAMASHRFHGDVPEPTDLATHNGWWKNDAELDRHIRAVSAAFPGFAQVSLDPATPPAWAGTLDTGRGKFTVGILTKRDRGLPSVVMLSKQRLGMPTGRSWKPAPHLYLNGNLCVADTSDWDPSEHTVATVIAWSAHWLAAYTEWRMTRRWPVAGAQQIAA